MYIFPKIPSSSQSFIGQVNSWKMGGIKRFFEQNSEHSEIRIFSRAVSETEESQAPSFQNSEKSGMRAWLTWQAWEIFTQHMSSAKWRSRAGGVPGLLCWRQVLLLRQGAQSWGVTEAFSLNLSAAATSVGKAAKATR